MKKLWFVALAVMACESGLARQVKLTVPSSVAQAFTASAPGIIVSDLGADAGRSYTLLCGQTTGSYDLEQDLGLGCLSDGPFTVGQKETARAWVQPMPPSWNASVCSSRTDRSFYEETSFAPVVDAGLDAGDADAGFDGFDGVAPSPEASWAQGSGSGSWQRNGSPCGGNLDVDVTLSLPSP